jgi:FkbM family methyltransferase
MESFSGNGEDLILTQYIFKKKKDGFYVDVGAFHPKHISNTYKLHKRGWRGINIDPNPESVSLFNKHRPKDTNLQLGISEIEEEKTYYSFSHSGINTFSEEHATKKLEKSWSTLLNTSKITCVPLAKILSEHVPAGTNIDLLDVDVEGLDLEVLKSNDWSKYKPSVILVEDRDFRVLLEKSPLFSFLKEHSYIFHSYADITLIMVREDFSVS